MSDVSNMPAGAEVDALAAVEVMGWTLVKDSFGSRWFNRPYGMQQRYVNDWRPSTSIADAFQLVAKMRERGLCFRVDYANTDLTRMHATFWDNKTTGASWNVEIFHGHAETFPLAITRAAVLAVRGMAQPTKESADSPKL